MSRGEPGIARVAKRLRHVQDPARHHLRASAAIRLYKAKAGRVRGKTQTRVREMLESDRARRSVGPADSRRPWAWYRAQPIAAFGDRTAEALVKEGKGRPWCATYYLDFLSQGNFA